MKSRRLTTRHVAAVAFPDAQILDLVGPLEVFSRASRLLAESRGARGVPAYTVEVLASERGPVAMSSGVAVLAARALREVREGVHTLFVAGGRGTEAQLGNRALLAWIRRMSKRVERLAAVCTGAFVLAEAGLLDGAQATTHWASCAELAARYPRIRVKPDPIFVSAGKIYTTAGVTAGMDLALALVEQDHGPQLAREVARHLVLFLQRPGGQSQFSSQLRTQLTDHAPLTELCAWAGDHLDADLSVPALAARAGMSPRNFARLFAAEVGVTPARHVAQLRLEAARRRLEESEAGLDQIARECGFGTREALRRAFQRELHVSPGAFRARFARST